MFRSADMQHGILVLPAERARDLIEMLGTKTNIQFVDMNSYTMKRPYIRYIQRIDEMERILRFLFEEIKKLPDTQILPADIEKFLSMPSMYNLDHVEQTLKKLYEQFLRFQENNMDLSLQKNTAIEEKAVVRVAYESLSHGASSTMQSLSYVIPNQEATDSITRTDNDGASFGQQTSSTHQSFIGFTNFCGVIVSSEQDRFSRTIFRATRGNTYTFFEPIPNEFSDIKTGKKISKSVFVIYFQSSSTSSAIENKIKRICQAYGATMHTWPKTLAEAKVRYTQLEEMISENSKALSGYEGYFLSEAATLLEVHSPAGGSLIEEYRLFCLKEKAIYTTLNMFEGEEITLRADCWLPKSEEDLVRQLLLKTVNPNQASAFLLTEKYNVKSVPPTYIRVTSFTSAFQVLIDTYGIPRYKEINPAIVTIVTFPFLFGIMYGDIGHATCLFVFAVFLIQKWSQISKSQNEIVQMIGGGRYMLLLMSAFGIFAGLLYNDFFSLGLNLFGSRYVLDRSEKSTLFYKMKSDNSVYPIGIDPAWKGANNEILFTNSFKMKFSIVVGFFQMILGIIFQGINAIYFKDHLTLLFDFVPRLLFMLCIVGYMVFMIFHKWITPQRYIHGVINKPMIITSLIEMIMMQKPAIYAFEQQVLFQRICLICIAICIPTMLLPKLFILKYLNSRKVKRKKLEASNTDVEWGSKTVEDTDEPFDFTEVIINQVIETIEFILGSISNTASYLRLWALSLAHQQLSLVFFNMSIKAVLNLQVNVVLAGIMLFFAFAIFAGVTFGVLLCMDTLECLLHALRLQWVEFQNKFYHADGYAFQPFTFYEILKQT